MEIIAGLDGLRDLLVAALCAGLTGYGVSDDIFASQGVRGDGRHLDERDRNLENLLHKT